MESVPSLLEPLMVCVLPEHLRNTVNALMESVLSLLEPLMVCVLSKHLRNTVNHTENFLLALWSLRSSCCHWCQTTHRNEVINTRRRGAFMPSCCSRDRGGQSRWICKSSSYITRSKKRLYAETHNTKNTKTANTLSYEAGLLHWASALWT